MPIKLNFLAFMLAVVTVVNVDECGNVIPAETVRQRQAIVDLCIERGGIPVLDTHGMALAKCEFPPVAPIIRLPEVGQ